MIRSLLLAALCGFLPLDAEDAPAAAHGGQARLVGDDIVELVIDEAAGKLTLYIVGEDHKPYFIAAEPLATQVKIPGATALQSIQLQPVTQADTPAGKANVFSCTDAGLAGKSGLTVIVHAELDEKKQRIVFAPAKK